MTQNYGSPKMVPRPLLSSHLSPEQNVSSCDPMEIAELNLTINQLRNSLQISNENAQRLQ